MRFSRGASPDRLRRFLSQHLDAPLSYPEVGASLGELPAGYHHDAYDIRLGDGDTAYRRATQGLHQWRAHRGAHVTVYPPDASLTPGTTVALALPLPGIHALAACRIVAVLREAGRFGFAYGTVEGHPERGEEAFVVERDGEAVRFRITSFSQPADPLARLGAPATRFIQRRVTHAYLAGLRAFVAGLAHPSA